MKAVGDSRKLSKILLTKGKPFDSKDPPIPVNSIEPNVKNAVIVVIECVVLI
jgi:hypothetical protein